MSSLFTQGRVSVRRMEKQAKERKDMEVEEEEREKRREWKEDCLKRERNGLCELKLTKQDDEENIWMFEQEKLWKCD